MAVDFLDLNLPDNITEQFKSEIIQDLAFKVKKRIFMPNSDSMYHDVMLRFNVRDRRIQRIKDILKIMFLPSNEEWDKSALKSFLPPFSYFYRFIHVLSDY